MSGKQRLVVCLDGTWNTSNEWTNVYHHYTSVVEGEVVDPDGSRVRQHKFYTEGIGLGSTRAKVAGGGFGFGIEKWVLAGYQYLVEHCNDSSEGADEIYIFGFSRGAFAARSLVGMIATCGLLRLWAPLTVLQMWQRYSLLSTGRRTQGSLRERLLGKAVLPRKISELVMDPWRIDRAVEHSDPGSRVLGQRVEHLTESEEMLIRWSRRVRITYLGLYDTVGAIGFDALGIPGLRSRVALQHDTAPSTLIQSCRHALAVDEHRSNFQHMPLTVSVAAGGPNSMPNSAQAVQAMWRRKLEQRWFVGAHSNIGGGYPDNRLAQRPYEWVLDGAKQAGLVCRSPGELRPIPGASLPLPRDSYTEFAKPLWSTIFRGKRHYRIIDPEPDLRAQGGTDHEGFAVVSVNEQVDPSVLSYWQAHSPPPNVIEFARRKHADPQTQPELKGIAEQEPQHLWLGFTMLPYIILVMWATLSSFGLAAIEMLVFGRPFTALPPWLLGSVAFAFAVIDWAESYLNFSMVLRPTSSHHHAIRDLIYWLRATGVVSFALGSLLVLYVLFGVGWNQVAFGKTLSLSRFVTASWLVVPVGAALGIVICDMINGGRRTRLNAIRSAVSGVILACTGAAVVVLMAAIAALILAPGIGPNRSYSFAVPAADANFAGLVLFIEVAFITLMFTWWWVTEPLREANIGSALGTIFRSRTSIEVKQALEQSRKMLNCPWLDQCETHGPAAHRLRHILRLVLWRDVYMFTPHCAALFALAGWLASGQLGWESLNKTLFHAPLWLVLPVVFVIAALTARGCALGYLRSHERGKDPASWAPPVTFAAILIVGVSLLCCILAMFLMLLHANVVIATLQKNTGWRGTAVLLFSALLMIYLGSLFIRAAVLSWRKRQWTSR